jgi:multidrug efflux pump subunit AcrA (membrane-fusion protein)
MAARTWIVRGIFAAALIAVGVAAYITRDRWAGSTPPAATGHDDEAGHGPIVSETTRVQISPQAEAGLRIETRPVRLRQYWRSVEIPGMVVDRPGESDRAIPAPAAGFVTAVAARPGDTVRAGDLVATIRVVSEVVQTAQADLFKTVREIQLTAETRERLTRPDSGVPPGRLIELDQQDRRQKAAAEAARQLLLNAGLRPEQVAEAEKGVFATEVRVTVPAAGRGPLIPSSSALPAPGDGPVFEVQELKVHVGDSVQAGQTMVFLADHRALYVEGRAFKREAGALARAAEAGWPVRAEFVEEAAGRWPEMPPLTIRHLANAVDPVSRTFAFYLPLTNQADPYTKDGQTFLNWRFRPGQRVRLRVPIEKWEGVYVLPTEGVVRDGAETYVFRRNGDYFERRAVTVLHEDSSEVVLKDDGAVAPGQHLTVSGAAALNRALKAAQSSGGPNVHVHADGTVHSSH